ncbi:MAG: putative toxin-antitoxin system toxin component, PIN family [Chloroflexi bacterium]|nr:putative toxin-antitoxin system toxin component, PIN family [Chloroflexota bacterium]
MKVLIDTNVIVSAALKDKAPEKLVLCVVAHPDLEWIASREILREYKEVLHRPKFGLPAAILAKWETAFDTSVTIQETVTPIEFARDQKDAKFLACALGANAEFFVTGDFDFREAQKLVNTNIVSVAMFNNLFCEENE